MCDQTNSLTSPDFCVDLCVTVCKLEPITAPSEVGSMRKEVAFLPQVMAGAKQVLILQPQSHLTRAEHAAPGTV